MYPDLADKKIGSTGHSQGGQAAFTVLALAEEKFGAPTTSTRASPWSRRAASVRSRRAARGSSSYAKIKSPMFMFSGTADVLVSEGWVQPGLRRDGDGQRDVLVVGATARRTSRCPTAETQQVSIPWFRWKLLGDKAACEAFIALEAGARWTKVQCQNEKTCN